MEEKKQPLTFDDNLIKSQSICKFSSPPQKNRHAVYFRSAALLIKSQRRRHWRNEWNDVVWS